MKTIQTTTRHTAIALFTLIAIAVLLPAAAWAHCQIPCGIYDDHARVQAMLEDAATIRKGVVELNALAGQTDVQSLNQIVRWVGNKEEYAQKIIATISDYFLTQRVNPDQADYMERLKKHHAVILAAMKAKQNADLATVDELTAIIQALAPYYPEHDHDPAPEPAPAMAPDADHGHDHDHDDGHDHDHSRP